ncbi:hypothetical protein [Agaribacter flavus]|uniref:Uncharacterized protein n=1 Tax=Agaribacter flavus TaxID=1902781 RepID=A0ABV7FVE5_9ALTE
MNTNGKKENQSNTPELQEVYLQDDLQQVCGGLTLKEISHFAFDEFAKTGLFDTQSWQNFFYGYGHSFGPLATTILIDQKFLAQQFPDTFAFLIQH